MLVIGTPWLAVVGLEETFERLTAESLAGGIHTDPPGWMRKRADHIQFSR